MNKERLIELFNFAINGNYKYIGVKVLVEGLSKSEIVISQFENFKERLEYYTKNFYDDLKMMNISYVVKITNCTCGDTFEEIEKDLIN